jgi:hypothetical protein
MTGGMNLNKPFCSLLVVRCRPRSRGLTRACEIYSRTSSPSTSSVTSKASSDFEAPGGDLHYVTEKFSGFLADFFAEYGSPKEPRSPEILPTTERGTSLGSGETALPPSDAHSRQTSLSQVPESPAPGLWGSESQDYTSGYSDEDGEEGDDSDREDNEDASTVADGDDSWEDEDAETSGSPGSDIELNDGLIKRGMYVSILLRHPERSAAFPCSGKILEVHDRRGKFTVRLSKSARRSMRAMLNSPKEPHHR